MMNAELPDSITLMWTSMPNPEAIEGTVCRGLLQEQEGRTPIQRNAKYQRFIHDGVDALQHG